MAALFGMTDYNQIHALVEEFDDDKSGSICFTEFVGMMLASTPGEEESDSRELKGHLVGFREVFNILVKDKPQP